MDELNPSQPGAQAASGATAALDSVCIAKQEDGSYLVYPTSAGPEAGTPAPDVDTAMEQVKQMLGGDTQAATGQPGEQSADSLFEQGFNTVRGVPLNRAG